MIRNQARSSGMARVQKFDTNGHFITKFGSAGSGDDQFTDPEHLAVYFDGKCIR